jgi:sigma-B regulation protein RsbU (phosphoserine phosphatase)
VTAREVLLSDAVLLAFGSLVTSATTVIDVLSVNSGGDMRYTKYAFLVFVFTASAILAMQFTGVYGELEKLRVSLERKVAERNVQLAEAVERQKRIGVEIEHQSRRLKDAKEVAERDLAIAERVQRGIFPTSPPLVPGWDLALAFRPAATISGDFFDFYLDEGRLSGLVLGDVSGHGMGAGLVAVLARSSFARHWAELGKIPLGDLLVHLHRDLEGELGGVDEYLTCLLLRIDGNKVEYANAAHPDLLYRKAGVDKAMAVLPRGKDDFRGPPLGKGGYEGGWAALRFNPGPGDLLLLYTDCLEEAKGPAGERFGKERLLESFSKASTASADAALKAVIADVEAFTGGSFEDDLTAIMLMREA